MSADAALAEHGIHDRLHLARVGLWLFILSESMIFVGLLAVRFYLQGFHVPDEADQAIGLGITAVLLVSSLTAYRAEAAVAAGDQRTFLRNLWATIGLGALFLVGVGFEWREALHAFPPSTGFGTVFFAMTGMHAFHVVTGLAFLAIVWVKARREAFGPHGYWPAEAAVKYWHFVDVVWVFFYPALYLVS